MYNDVIVLMYVTEQVSVNLKNSFWALIHQIH